MTYTYDPLGNRLTRTDAASNPRRETRYWYDTNVADHPAVTPPFQDTGEGNQSLNNRLLAYQEFEGQPGQEVLKRTVRYT
ncbi:hypothetical protein RAS1_14690 [Phycisphaerae bacterium RAS1]|nr:hypothetical protein RAS1_14690 [Phycisphaerae bacterium RAS1]